MSSINSYKDLRVWNMAMDLTAGIDQLSNGYSQDERFGLLENYDQLGRMLSTLISKLDPANKTPRS